MPANQAPKYPGATGLATFVVVARIGGVAFLGVFTYGVYMWVTQTASRGTAVVIVTVTGAVSVLGGLAWLILPHRDYIGEPVRPAARPVVVKKIYVTNNYVQATAAPQRIIERRTERTAVIVAVLTAAPAALRRRVIRAQVEPVEPAALEPARPDAFISGLLDARPPRMGAVDTETETR